MKKLCAILTLVVIINLGFGIAAPAPVRADTFDAVIDVLGAVATYAAIREMFHETEFKMQSKVFEKYKREHGVSRDAASNEMLHRIFTRVGAAPGNGDILARPPSYFVVPDGAINAFRALGNVIAVNAGVFYEFGFNEDMAAFIVTHEMGHGIKQHSLRQLEGVLPLQIAKELIAKRYGEYIPELQYRLAGLVLLHIRNNGYSVPFEYEADNTGFEYAVNAGYNPGGAAAAFVRMNSYYEDKPSLFQALFNPRTHPTNQKRIENFANKLTAYSGNNVSVNGTGVYVKGQLLLNTKRIGERMAEERAFLVAGNLARVFHQSPRPTESATVEYGSIMLAGRRIVTPVHGEPTADELCNKLNKVLGFPDTPAGATQTGTPKASNPHWIEL